MSYYIVCNDDTLKPWNNGSSSIALKVGTERTLSFSNYLPNPYCPDHSKLLLGSEANHCAKGIETCHLNNGARDNNNMQF